MQCVWEWNMGQTIVSAKNERHCWSGLNLYPNVPDSRFLPSHASLFTHVICSSWLRRRAGSSNLCGGLSSLNATPLLHLNWESLALRLHESAKPQPPAQYRRRWRVWHSPNKCKQSADSSQHLLHLKGPMTFSNHGISERGIAELANTNGILLKHGVS